MRICSKVKKRHALLSRALLFAFLILSLSSFAGPSPCSEYVHAFVKRISSEGSSRLFSIRVTAGVKTLTKTELSPLKAQYIAESMDGKSLRFNVSTPEKFSELQEKFQKRGF